MGAGDAARNDDLRPPPLIPERDAIRVSSLL